MRCRTLSFVTACALIVGTFACDSKPSSPAAPTADTSSPDGSATLKATAPAIQSPTNDTKLTSAPLLIAGASSMQFPSDAGVPSFQYRFQVMNGSGQVVDNALVNGTTHTVTATLVANARHTWRVRAEVGGEVGP